MTKQKGRWSNAINHLLSTVKGRRCHDLGIPQLVCSIFQEYKTMGPDRSITKNEIFFHSVRCNRNIPRRQCQDSQGFWNILQNPQSWSPKRILNKNKSLCVVFQEGVSRRGFLVLHCAFVWYLVVILRRLLRQSGSSWVIPNTTT